MYRFKTKEEFLREFGHGWRIAVPCNWIEDMDFLLGRELTPLQSETYERGGMVQVPGGYSISKEMITDLKLTLTSGKPNIAIRKKRIKINVSI